MLRSHRELLSALLVSLFFVVVRANFFPGNRKLSVDIRVPAGPSSQLCKHGTSRLRAAPLPYQADGLETEGFSTCE